MLDNESVPHSKWQLQAPYLPKRAGTEVRFAFFFISKKHLSEEWVMCDSLEQPFSMGGPATFEGGHSLETILQIPPHKVHYVIYTILIWPTFLSYFAYRLGLKKD